ncbi:uncharacterized protein LOC127846629 [Dreissena polymorpha]|uniref:CUB domain-containing protein n=1 Tax=Dreissena polymorpha TaxID=45954 RepID=A0A9D4IDY3_DREPO|nr:uncharacterized protein LOC127846629 [Dreissena polymorpha]KAH3771816.1 hypothetical protein DPMN_173145 [Dreissena polymorpha]
MAKLEWYAQLKVFSLGQCLLVIAKLPFLEALTQDLKTYTSCNDVIDMETQKVHQAALELSISSATNSDSRVSCDFTIRTGIGSHVMFYFTELYLGSPNRTERVDRACLEPRDVNGPYESVPTGMRPIICSKTEVEIGSKVYATTGNALSLRFYRNRGFGIDVHFKIVFAAFRLGSCRTSERKCNNERCIAHEIVCNGHNPCGDHSDCPTGLEHLSSWAMSGIVILGLLCGGIVIIMATVCLQRAGSKRYEMDDIILPTNGDLRHECPHVELNAIHVPSRRSTDPDGDVRKSEHNETQGNQATNCGISSDFVPQFEDNLDLNGDRERLLHHKHTRDIVYPQETLENKRDPFISMRSENHTPKNLFQSDGDLIFSSAYGQHIPDRYSANMARTSTFRRPDSENSNRRLETSGYFEDKHSNPRLSGHSLVMSDSDSGNDEDRADCARPQRSLRHQEGAFHASTASEIFKRQNMAKFAEVMSPPPLHYGTLKNMTSALKMNTNDVTTTIATC